MQKVVIIGAGAFAREVVDVFDAVNSLKQTYDVLGYVVEPQYRNDNLIINDKPILGELNWLEDHKSEVQAICGIGTPEVRMRLVKYVESMGIRFCRIVHPHAVLTRWVEIGEGTVVTAGCILTNQIRLSDHVHLNLACTVGHDVVIKNFVTVSPGVNISGNVVLDEGCYVGTGASVLEKKTIGEWSVVGAGSVVISDIPPNSTAVGVPCKVVKTRASGWHIKDALP